MKRIMILAVLALGTFCGCNRETAVAIVPLQEADVAVNVGDSFEVVVDKLGEPNIDSRTPSSRVLIYDKLELKLQSNVVVEVFDHR